MYNYVKLYEMYDGFCYKFLNRSINNQFFLVRLIRVGNNAIYSPKTPPVTTIYTLLINRPTVSQN